MNLNKLMGGKRKVKDNNESDLKLFADTILKTTRRRGLWVNGRQYWTDNSLEFTFSLDDNYKKNIAKIKIPSGSFAEMKENLIAKISKWLSKHNGTTNGGVSPEFFKGMNSLYYDLITELNSQVSDSRRVKDSGQFVSKNEKYQKIKKDIIYEANTILDNLNGGADWYDYSYFNWFSVYEDGQPMTARVYSNNNSDWQFDVYLKNEEEEMMLNVMQNYGGFMRFNGTDYADYGKSSDAISMETFLAIFVENIIEGTM